MSDRDFKSRDRIMIFHDESEYSNENMMGPRYFSLNKTIKSEYDNFECIFCDSLWQLCYPAFLAFGLCGNALCLLAFAAHTLRRETRLVCSVCATLDSLALAFAFASRWPDLTFAVSSMNPALCHVLTVANYWLPELAAWTVAYSSLERFLSGKTLLLIACPNTCIVLWACMLSTV